jgi:hypothetical protein
MYNPIVCATSNAYLFLKNVFLFLRFPLLHIASFPFCGSNDAFSYLPTILALLPSHLNFFLYLAKPSCSGSSHRSLCIKFYFNALHCILVLSIPFI